MRFIVRKMRTSSSLDSIMPPTRQRLMAALLVDPKRSWYGRDLARHLKLAPSTLQRDLKRLQRGGVVRAWHNGNRVYFQADTQSPIFPELRSLLVKTVGVVDVTSGSEEKIVELMLGQVVKDMTAVAARTAASDRASGTGPRLAAHNLSAGTRLHDVSFHLYPGEVLGVVALEGQGQDELFDVLAGSQRPSGGEMLVDSAVRLLKQLKP